MYYEKYEYYWKRYNYATDGNFVDNKNADYVAYVKNAVKFRVA